MPPEIQDFSDNSSAPQATRESLARWEKEAQAHLDAGGTMDDSGQWDPAHGKFGMMAGYGVSDDGQLEQDTNIGTLWRDLAMTVGGAYAAPWLAGAFGASAAPTLEATMNAEQAAGGSIPAMFGATAADTVSSAAPRAGFFSRLGQAALGSRGGGGASSGGGKGLLEKYALPAVSGVFNNLAANKRNQDALQQRESELDPYRGQMHQASDVARLDQMATGDFRASPTAITGRYAHSYQPTTPWLPSDTVRNVAAQGEDQVARGQGATLGQPLPRVRFAGQSPAALLAAAARRRQLAGAVDDSNSPWLAGAV